MFKKNSIQNLNKTFSTKVSIVLKFTKSCDKQERDQGKNWENPKKIWRLLNNIQVLISLVLIIVLGTLVAQW